MALTPLIIPWGADASSDVLRMIGAVYAIPSVGARRCSILTRRIADRLSSVPNRRATHGALSVD